MKITLLKIAYLFGQHSKCVSKQVGAVIARDGRIISTGYNGTPSGFKNCNSVFDPKSFDREEHHTWSKTYEIHAEQNAIAFSAKSDISVDGAEIYCILQPCDDCLKLIKAAGIKKVYYVFEYDKSTKDNELWSTIEHEKVDDLELLLWIKNQECFDK